MSEKAVVIKFGEAADVKLGRSDDDSPILEFSNPSTGKSFVVDDVAIVKAMLAHLEG